MGLSEHGSNFATFMLTERKPDASPLVTPLPLQVSPFPDWQDGGDLLKLLHKETGAAVHGNQSASNIFFQLSFSNET